MRSMLIVAAMAVVLGGAARAQTGQVHDVGNGVIAPRLIKEVKPNYTDSAKSRGVQGWVELSAVILVDGTVSEEMKITRSLDEDLDLEAMKAVRQWKFKPGTKEGEPVAVRVNIELSFTLRDKK